MKHRWRIMREKKENRAGFENNLWVSILLDSINWTNYSLSRYHPLWLYLLFLSFSNYIPTNSEKRQNFICI